MLDSHPDPLAVDGGTGTAARIDDAKAHLLMLRSLLVDVNESVHRLVPPSTGAWRSEAAQGYAQGLEQLRLRVVAARDGLAAAEGALARRILRMEAQLETARAASGTPSSVGMTTDASWPTR
jgi:hypothetical protein